MQTRLRRAINTADLEVRSRQYVGVETILVRNNLECSHGWILSTKNDTVPTIGHQCIERQLADGGKAWDGDLMQRVDVVIEAEEAKKQFGDHIALFEILPS